MFLLFSITVEYFLVNITIKNYTEFNTYYKTIRMYIFSCNMKSVQKLDFNSLSRIISGQFFVQKFML